MRSGSVSLFVLILLTCLGLGFAQTGKSRSSAVQERFSFDEPAIKQMLIRTHQLPDPTLTSGAVRTTDVHDICTRPTSDIRKVTARTKRLIFQRYGVPDGNHTGFCSVKEGCEVDHLISLELGGSNDPRNLFPEPYTELKWNAHVKDRLENKLHRMICQGNITPEEAQRKIAGNWIQSYCEVFAGDALCAVIP